MRTLIREPSPACTTTSFVNDENDAESRSTRNGETWVKGGARMNPRDAMVRVTHPPTDKESKDEDRNRWSFRSSDSLKLPAPGFFELDALINRVSLKKNNNNIRHEKRERPTTHRISRSSMIFQNSSSASFNDHIVSLRPRPTIPSLVDTRQRVCDRHENTRPRRRRGDCIHVEKQKTSVDFNRCLPYHMTGNYRQFPVIHPSFRFSRLL